MMRFVLLFMLLLTPQTHAPKKPKFHVNQVVAVTLTEPPQFIQIGFVSRRTYANGEVYFLYTENDDDVPPFYFESVLRHLNEKECDGEYHAANSSTESLR